MIYSISIICYQKRGLSKECLTSVLANSSKDPDRVEILVTDNGSTDGTGIMLRHDFKDPRIKVIRNASNRGVIGPKRHALSMATGAYFVSLDNDCTVGPGWLAALRKPFRDDPKVAQVGRENAFCTLNAKGIGHHGARVDYIDGSCFMVNREVAERIGLCDPAYQFAYCEDSDFSLRLRKGGWRIAVANAAVKHRRHQTAHNAGLNLKAYWERNHALFVSRWAGYLRTQQFGHLGEPL